MELLNGIMAKFFKDSGETEQKMVMECGNLQKEIFMRENGGSIDNMVKEFTSIVSVLIEDILLIFSKVDRVKKYSQMVIDTSVSIKKVSLMEKENIFGLMAVHLKDCFSKVLDKALEFGNILMELFIKDSLKMILNMEKVLKDIRLVKDLMEYLKKERNFKVLYMILTTFPFKLPTKTDFSSYII